MDLEEYFEFDPAGPIFLKGTDVGIECLLEPWREGYHTADILRRYHPRVTLEQVYASITYYLNQKARMDAYLDRCRRNGAPPAAEDQGHDAPIRVLRAHGLRGYLRTLDQPGANQG